MALFAFIEFSVVMYAYIQLQDQKVPTAVIEVNGSEVWSCIVAGLVGTDRTAAADLAGEVAGTAAGLRSSRLIPASATVEVKPRKHAAARVPHFWRVEQDDGKGHSVVHACELVPAPHAYGLTVLFHGRPKLSVSFGIEICPTAVGRRRR
ncbi:hypothetical protein [Streptomyces sp. NBC_00078]|uniref:hypothetical protein n=2 Tax=unclassified Streptomyces TaxID=2593676 RepID=UPI00224C8458|nr:hypothetical protein [Streptomyces sp. NBC_00078]